MTLVFRVRSRKWVPGNEDVDHREADLRMGHIHDENVQVEAAQGLQAVLDLHLEIIVRQVGQAVQGRQRVRGPSDRRRPPGIRIWAG